MYTGKFKKKENLLCETYDEGEIILDLQNDQYHLLNHTASIVFQSCDQMMVDDIIQLLHSIYVNEDENEITNDTIEIISRLKNLGLIIEE